MARPDLLSSDLISRNLSMQPLWRLDEHSSPQSIVREIQAANWTAAIGIVNAIALVAEVMDHHPDILIYGWNKVRVSCSTHDRGGLTELDFKLADKIDGLALS